MAETLGRVCVVAAFLLPAVLIAIGAKIPHRSRERYAPTREEEEQCQRFQMMMLAAQRQRVRRQCDYYSEN